MKNPVITILDLQKSNLELLFFLFYIILKIVSSFSNKIIMKHLNKIIMKQIYFMFQK